MVSFSCEVSWNNWVSDLLAQHRLIFFFFFFLSSTRDAAISSPRRSSILIVTNVGARRLPALIAWCISREPSIDRTRYGYLFWPGCCHLCIARCYISCYWLWAGDLCLLGVSLDHTGLCILRGACPIWRHPGCCYWVMALQLDSLRLDRLCAEMGLRNGQ